MKIGLQAILFCILFLLLSGCSDVTGEGEEKSYITVPQDYATIQEAIDAAEEGDTVLVNPGRYFENINFNKKAVVVASQYVMTNDEAYIASTVIDGSDSATSVVNISGVTDSIDHGLLGLRICKGRTGKGAGISVSSCSPTIAHCLIDSNQAFGSTWTWVPFGGGVRLYNSGATIKNCTIRNNYSHQFGAGVSVQSCNVEVIIDNCVISNNRTNSGNIHCDGGGLFLDSSIVKLTNSTVLNNEANYGGAITAALSTLSLERVVIAQNSASNSSGGVYLQNENTISMNHCTVADNSIAGLSGSDMNATVTNSIFWNNGESAIDGSAAITYSDVEGGVDGDGNISSDPLFVNGISGDYTLQITSPCINKGCLTECEYVGAAPDMGAIEKQ